MNVVCPSVETNAAVAGARVARHARARAACAAGALRRRAVRSAPSASSATARRAASRPASSGALLPPVPWKSLRDLLVGDPAFLAGHRELLFQRFGRRARPRPCRRASAATQKMTTMRLCARTQRVSGAIVTSFPRQRASASRFTSELRLRPSVGPRLIATLQWFASGMVPSRTIYSISRSARL